MPAPCGTTRSDAWSVPFADVRSSVAIWDRPARERTAAWRSRITHVALTALHRSPVGVTPSVGASERSNSSCTVASAVLNRPASAVGVLQIIVAAEPKSAVYYRFLADYAYKAKNTRIGDLAAAKAVSLAPPAQRTRLKTELASLKKNGGKEAAIATTNGKTYTVNPAGNGSYTGTVPSTTAPAGTK